MARWLSSARADDVEQRKSALIAEHRESLSRIEKLQRTKRLASSAMTVGGLGIVATLVLRGYELIGGLAPLATGVVLLAMGALGFISWRVSGRIHAERTREELQELESLEPMYPWQLRMFDDNQTMSPRASQWVRYVGDVLQRPIAHGDKVVVDALAALDWSEGAHLGHRALRAYPPVADGPELNAKDLAQYFPLSDERRAMSTIDRKTAETLLGASEAELSVEQSMHQKLVEKYRPREQTLAKIWAWAPGTIYALFAVVPAAVWPALSGREIPAGLQLLANLGFGVFVVGIGPIFYCIRGWDSLPESIAVAKRRLTALEPVGPYEANRSLELLAKSGEARAWHRQVVVAQQRQLRVQDFWAMNQLARLDSAV